MADFLERMREQEKWHVRIILFVLIVGSIIMAGMLFVQQMNFTQKSGFIQHEWCGAELNSEITLQNSHSNIDPLISAIANYKNVSSDNINFIKLEKSEVCENNVGSWLESTQTKERFLYCRYNNKVFIYNLTECEKFSPLDLAKKTYSSIINFIMGNKDERNKTIE